MRIVDVEPLVAGTYRGDRLQREMGPDPAGAALARIQAGPPTA